MCSATPSSVIFCYCESKSHVAEDKLPTFLALPNKLSHGITDTSAMPMLSVLGMKPGASCILGTVPTKLHPSLLKSV